MGRINGKSDDPTKDSYGNYSERTTLFVLACLGVFFFRDFIFSDDMLYGSDTLGLGYMAREFYSYIIKSGSFPFWNPFILGGTPFIESLAGGDSLYPGSPHGFTQQCYTLGMLACLMSCLSLITKIIDQCFIFCRISVERVIQQFHALQIVLPFLGHENLVDMALELAVGSGLEVPVLE